MVSSIGQGVGLHRSSWPHPGGHASGAATSAAVFSSWHTKGQQVRATREGIHRGVQEGYSHGGWGGVSFLERW